MSISDRSQKAVLWITFAFSMVFVVFGLGFLFKLILPEKNFFNGGFRIALGLLLTIYGLIRGTMILRRLKRLKIEFSDNKIT